MNAVIEAAMPVAARPDSAVADVVVLVVGADVPARARTIRSLGAQSCRTRVLAEGEVLSAGIAGVVLIVHAGVELDFTACERLAWLLRSSGAIGWVTGGSYEAPSPSSLADAVLAVCAARTDEACVVLGEQRWREAAGDGRGAPGLALQLVVAMHRRGVRGLCTGQPVVAQQGTTREWTQLCVQARSTLEVLSLDLERCLESRGDRPPVLPLQHVDHESWPAAATRTVGRPGDAHRILMLVQGFPMGGYTAFNADLIPRLVARGHHVTTACTEWWRSTWRLGQVQQVAPDIHHLPSSVAFATIPAYIAHLMETRQIDVVFMSHSFLSYRLLPLLREAFPHVAFVDYVHTEWFETQMYGSYATMSAQFTPLLDAQVVSSHALADSLVCQGAERSRVHVAHIGIDTAVWNSDGIDRTGVRSAFGATPESTVLLFAGRMSPEKRPWLAVEALDRLRGEGRDVRLVVAGDGPLLRQMNELLESRGLSDFAALLGEVDEDTLRQVYAASDIYFAPSEIEGIARTLYEAMALGCVPVVSDVGGQRELVPPQCGSLVPPGPGDVTGYLPALRYWCDAEVRAAASRAARAHVTASFDSAHTVAAIERAIDAAVADVRRDRADVSAAAADQTVHSALAKQMAVMGLEITRRHAAAAG